MGESVDQTQPWTTYTMASKDLEHLKRRVTHDLCALEMKDHSKCEFTMIGDMHVFTFRYRPH